MSSGWSIGDETHGESISRARYWVFVPRWLLTPSNIISYSSIIYSVYVQLVSLVIYTIQHQASSAKTTHTCWPKGKYCDFNAFIVSLSLKTRGNLFRRITFPHGARYWGVYLESSLAVPGGNQVTPGGHFLRLLFRIVSNVGFGQLLLRPTDV